MPPSHIATAFALALVAAGADAAMGNAFSSGPTADGNFIRLANSTLVVPEAPVPQVGLLSLWTGMGMSNGDLIQALVESYDGVADGECGLVHGDWCTYASVLEIVGCDQEQLGGRQIKTKPGDHVTLSYMYNDRTDAYDQYVYVNGVETSNYTSSKGGKALGWGTAEECQPDYPCGLIPAHDWVDVVLELEKAQPNYSDTFGNGGSTGTLKTIDGGKTWTGSKLHINEVYFDYPITYDTSMCPEANATTYTSRANRSYTVGCDIRYTGSDIKTVEEKSGKIADCVVYCDQVEGCVGVVLQDTTCHLKSSKGQQVSAQGVQAAFLQ
ncbi:hypothetical protein D6C78_09046 [Aureobasidium pullulans]|uniref:Apple domain-containing protein n=1 Tax=Aureobasidium pullulans TaxID=5580 RepID=A0A4T0BBZ8_AURPU|nr:hypothetical protein D6C78_09046 [Aureobasidium pullulans]